MEQKDKELLLKDLCARLPYKIKGERIWIDPVTESSKNGIYTFSLFDIGALTKGYSNCGKFGYLKIENYSFKPYLFPLSNMTEEQRKEYYAMVKYNITSNDNAKLMDWLNKHHFDYRGFIPKGLAIDATGLNIY